MSHSPLDKIQALDAIEKEIITCLQSAGECLKRSNARILVFLVHKCMDMNVSLKQQIIFGNH